MTMQTVVTEYYWTVEKPTKVKGTKEIFAFSSYVDALGYQREMLYQGEEFQVYLRRFVQHPNTMSSDAILVTNHSFEDTYLPSWSQILVPQDFRDELKKVRDGTSSEEFGTILE